MLALSVLALVAAAVSATPLVARDAKCDAAGMNGNLDRFGITAFEKANPGAAGLEVNLSQDFTTENATYYSLVVCSVSREYFAYNADQMLSCRLQKYLYPRASSSSSRTDTSLPTPKLEAPRLSLARRSKVKARSSPRLRVR